MIHLKFTITFQENKFSILLKGMLQGLVLKRPCSQETYCCQVYQGYPPGVARLDVFKFFYWKHNGRNKGVAVAQQCL